MAKVIDSTNLGYLISKIKAAFWQKAETSELTIDATPTANSNNLVKSGGVKAYVDGAIPTVPAISTDIQTDKASTTKTASPSAVYNEVHPAIATTQPQGGFLPNVVYDLGTITETVTFALVAASDNTIANAYVWTFETGNTAPTINWPSGLTWHGGAPPDSEASKHYEIMVRNGYASALVFDLPTS